MEDTTPAPNAFQQATETALYLRSNLPESLHYPKVAIVCGSGLGGLAETLHAEPRLSTPYANIPNFPISTVQGHEGKLIFGHMGPEDAPIPVVLLVGRAQAHAAKEIENEVLVLALEGSFHVDEILFYEGHSMHLVTFATRVCRMLGVQTIIVTNAAGGLNATYTVGDIVLLNDHLNLAGLVGFHPLRGPNVDDFGVRFPPLSDAYDLDLRRRAHRAWKELGLGNGGRRMHEGVYAFVAGPSYETRAECRLLHSLGADVVGMSTVPEIVVARHSGIRVLAFSLVTNNAVLEAGPRGDNEAIQGLDEKGLAEYLSKGKANHEEVLEAGREAAKDMQALVKKIVHDLYT